jgi:hypothetical protein
MINDLDNFYLQKPEPNKSCLLALRDIILNYDKNITAEWKYKLPFFYYKGKMFCYLWVHKKFNQPYIGFINGNKINHPKLIIENRKQIKIMLFNPNEDLLLKTIKTILKQGIDLYKTGETKIKNK